MEFKQLLARAASVRAQYAALETARYGRSWSRAELALGFVGDVGDLAKLLVAAEGMRAMPGARERLEHELADCLWSIMVLAQAHDVDLEAAFTAMCAELETHIAQQLGND